MATYSQVCSNVGSFTYGNRFTLYVVLTNRNGDPATNKSVVDYNVYFENTSGGGTFTSNTRLYFALNGGVIKDSTSSITGPRNGQVSIASGSITVDHNNDGTKAIGFHALVQGVSFGIKGEISGTFALNTIPRASTVSGGSGNIGSKTTISVSRKSNSFTHTLRYSFSDLTGTIATGVGTSYEWTIPTSFYAKIPYAKSYNGTIYCDTYNGSTLIGTKSTTFTATASESSSRPTVTGTVVDVNETTKALTGNANKLILGKSTARITVNPVARNSAVITEVTIDGVADTDYTIDKANVTKASFPIVVTDSRGYTNTAYSATATGGMVNYVALTLNAYFFRPEPTTGEVQLTYSGNYFNESFGDVSNTLALGWKYRVKGSSTWIDGGAITPTLNGNKIVQSTISLGTTFNYQTAYEFQMVGEDKLTSAEVITNVPMGTPVFNWGKDYFNVNGYLNLNNMALRTNYNVSATTGWKRIAKLDGPAYGDITITNYASYGNVLKLSVSAISHFSPKVTKHLYSYTNGAMFIQARIVYLENAASYLEIYQNLEQSKNLGIRMSTNSTGIILLNQETTGFVPTNYKTKVINLLEDGVMDSVVLYNNNSGTTGTVTLSENSASFKYMEIYYSSYSYKSEKVENPYGKNVKLHSVRYTNNGIYDLYKVVKVAETSITTQSEYRVGDFGTSLEVTSNPAQVKIHRVVGYR